jgi:5-(carboxyamino)imidazole ribonucleotide synthase
MRVGILGGGQLGAMLAGALAHLGAQPVVYDPDPDAPAHGQVTARVVAPFEDEAAMRAFLETCDVVTYEREDLPVDVLRRCRAAAPFVPDLDVLEIAQDRAREKAFFVHHGLPCVRHRVVELGTSLVAAADAFGYPAIAKTTRGGYDGKGQFVLRGAADANAAAASHQGASWVLEEPVSIVAEASCIVARSASGEVVFPVVENVHREHVLDRSLVPARLGPGERQRIETLALAAARAVDVRGLLAVEFFVTADGVLLNELAPRPHNSGHVLSRACTFGQFDALARVLVDAPLGAPDAHAGVFCMGNLLGDVWLAQRREAMLDLSAWQAFPDVVDVHVYGKRRPEPRRKMGHFVVRAASPEVAMTRAQEFRLALAVDAPTGSAARGETRMMPLVHTSSSPSAAASTTVPGSRGRTSDSA